MAQFFYLCSKLKIMKIKILKDVYTSKGWRYVGEVHDLDQKTSKHYIQKGIGIEQKEEKAAKETKENKSVKKELLKKSKKCQAKKLFPQRGQKL